MKERVFRTDCKSKAIIAIPILKRQLINFSHLSVFLTPVSQIIPSEAFICLRHFVPVIRRVDVMCVL